MHTMRFWQLFEFYKHKIFSLIRTAAAGPVFLFSSRYSRFPAFGIVDERGGTWLKIHNGQ